MCLKPFIRLLSSLISYGMYVSTLWLVFMEFQIFGVVHGIERGYDMYERNTLLSNYSITNWCEKIVTYRVQHTVN